ncbi:hypothetical protein XENOCAPTIV_009151, partial [Xenoophorus captivus]
VLLCHDDELEGRRVAFILYLVPPWQSSDGGTLDLYSTDSRYLGSCLFLQLYCWITAECYHYHQVISSQRV